VRWPIELLRQAGEPGTNRPAKTRYLPA